MIPDGSQLGQSYDFLLKMIIIGESGTGKSCLLHHFIHEEVKENTTHTIGVEFASRIVQSGKKNVKLQLWDTAGQERFRSVTKSYYRGASACLLVFDITRAPSFEPLEQWLSDARALASPDLVVVLVGNKLDRQAERQVSFEEASSFAQKHRIRYVETSSTQGVNIEEPFTYACETILRAIASGKINPESPGSGISYGDRGLRSVGTPNMTASGNQLTFSEVMPGGNRPGGGAISLQQQMKHRFDGCC